MIDQSLELESDALILKMEAMENTIKDMDEKWLISLLKSPTRTLKSPTRMLRLNVSRQNLLNIRTVNTASARIVNILADVFFFISYMACPTA